MDKKNLAFDKMNFILLGIGMAIIIIGFLLMSGAGSNEHTFDTDIFIGLPAVSNVTRDRITYSDTFRQVCTIRYLAGESPDRKSVV